MPSLTSIAEAPSASVSVDTAAAVPTTKPVPVPVTVIDALELFLRNARWPLVPAARLSLALYTYSGLVADQVGLPAPPLSSGAPSVPAPAAVTSCAPAFRLSAAADMVAPGALPPR